MSRSPSLWWHRVAVSALGVSLATSPLCAQPLDTARALGALRDHAAACAADGGRLWGISLCAPIALVEPATRMVIATDTVPRRPFLRLSDAFVHVLPGNLGLANTSFTWGDRPWAMVLLPLPADRYARVTLVAHEILHTKQATLGVGGSDPPNNQLDQREGRRLLRLELRALAAALDALPSDSDHVADSATSVRTTVDDRAARAHALAAMTFRARRHALYPGADTLEDALEMQEGLAEYTGHRLAMTWLAVGPSRVAQHVRAFESTPTYVRSFAYGTGPALGVLLDRFVPAWRTRIAEVRSPAALLTAALPRLSAQTLARDADRLAPRYGGAEIAQAEAARDSIRRPVMEGYRARLVNGPTITLRQPRLSRNFNPQTLVGFDMVSTVYPTGTFSADWGVLEVTANGALIANDYTWLRVAAPSTPPDGGRKIIGDGWTLTLAQGWMIRPTSNGGNYEVTRP